MGHWPGTYVGRRLCDDGGRSWNDDSQKSGVKPETTVSSVSRRIKPVNTLVLDCLNYCGRTISIVLRHLVCGRLLQRLYKMNTALNGTKVLHDLPVSTFLGPSPIPP